MLLLTGLTLAFCQTGDGNSSPNNHLLTKSVQDSLLPPPFKVIKTEDEWKKELTPQQYHVLREKGTERAFTGMYWNNYEHGLFRCAACDNPLFYSGTKFKSGTGWPSYYQPATDTSVIKIQDFSHGMIRTEVVCARCGGHLGHVFDDGPQPTGLRYCINSIALKLDTTVKE